MEFVNRQYQKFIEIATKQDKEFEKVLEMMLATLTEKQKEDLANEEWIDSPDENHFISGVANKGKFYHLLNEIGSIYYSIRLDMLTSARLKTIKKNGNSLQLMMLSSRIHPDTKEEKGKVYDLFLTKEGFHYKLIYVSKVFEEMERINKEYKYNKVTEDKKFELKLTKAQVKALIKLGENIEDTTTVGV